MAPSALDHLSNRIRVRVGALIFDHPESPQTILLVQHRGIFDERPFWTPPGGEVQFGESLTEALIREVREETQLEIAPGPLTYTLDFVRPPLHAVSFYFRATIREGTLHTGIDPELTMEEQLIQAVAFLPLNELTQYYVVPEGLTETLLHDMAHGFPPCARYLGTRH